MHADDTTIAIQRPDVSATTFIPLVGGEAAADRTSVLPILREERPVAAFAPPPPRDRPGRGGRLRLLFVLGLVAAIIAVALLAHPPADSPNPTHTPTPTPTRSSTRTPSPTSITLVQSDYIKRPYAEVAAALATLGLKAQRQDASGDAAADTVVDIGAGPYQRGDTVPVTVSSGPAPAPGKGHDKKGKD